VEEQPFGRFFGCPAGRLVQWGYFANRHMAHVVVRVGDNVIESVITRRSADELKLKKGDNVAAVVKATEVMIQKD
jgi:molybdopterin-binding protein